MNFIIQQGKRMTASITEDKSTADYDVLVSHEGTLTPVEMKTVQRAVSWSKLHAFFNGPADTGETGLMLRLLGQLCGYQHEDPLTLALKKFLKTTVSFYYLKRMAIRLLLRMPVLLHQKLATSAPVARLFLRNRARYILASHPSVAPPQAV